MRYDFDQVVDRTRSDSGKWSPSYLKFRFGHEDLLPLWVADMDFPCPQAVVDALVERARHGIYGYAAATDAYYQSIVEWNLRRHDWQIDKDWLLFTPGVVPALNYCIQAFCLPGDRVIIQSPVYPPFAKAVVNNGCQVADNPLKKEGGKHVMDFEGLEAIVKDPRTRLMLMCNPHNPVGRVWTEKELKEVGRICIENDVLVVSDEIHSDLIMKGHQHIPFANLSEDLAAITITCTAPSKTFNLAGLKSANMVVSHEGLRSRLASILENNGVKSGNLFGLKALEVAYREGEEWLDQVLAYIEGNFDYLGDYLTQYLPEVGFEKPEGTYLAWLDFSALGMSTQALEDWLHREPKLALNQGYTFGSGGELFLRVNVACSRTILEEALNRLTASVKKWRINQT